ncbi:hypothetical protein ABTZ78_17230 [Streptomyces bauhiniae]|uniref:hypothetical protein n=1 Tax=Streptomyces bauhiniae TaxID=2340725 RepID=UPI0033215A4C
MTENPASTPDPDENEDDSTYTPPPPGWDPDDYWEPSNNDALNYENDPEGPNDFYEP